MRLLVKRFCRLKLLTWILIISIFCCLAFVYACFVRPSLVEAGVMRRLENLGIDVTFHYEHESDGIGFDGMSGKAVPPGPKWVKAVFGEKVFARIKHVRIEGEVKSLDNCCKLLSNLVRLRSLAINSSVLEDVTALEQLKKLNRVSFNGEGSSSLRDIDSLANLELSHVAFFQCDGINNLGSLGVISSLEKLEIQYCNGITELNFSGWKTKNFKRILVSNCDRLVTMVGFPRCRQSCFLQLWDCNSLENITIPRDSNLCEISVESCCKLMSVVGLPKNLKDLRVVDCDSLRKITGPELTRLKFASIVCCNDLESFEVSIGRAEFFSLIECDSIRHLVFLPQVKEIYIKSCNGLVSICDLPEGVEKLELLNCRSLEQVTLRSSLPNLKIFCSTGCPRLLKQSFGGSVRTKKSSGDTDNP